MPRGEQRGTPAAAGPAEQADADATAAFLAGGPGALRAAYDAHAALVHTFCRRALGPGQAADLTQEVFVEVWRARERFDPDRGSLRGWVMGIARHKVLGALRHDGARPVVPMAEAPPAASAGSTGGAEPDAERLADRLTLARALATLPDRTRKAIQLAYVDGLSHREIAELTGAPLGTVKSDIRRGLARMRADLEVGG